MIGVAIVGLGKLGRKRKELFEATGLARVIGYYDPDVPEHEALQSEADWKVLVRRPDVQVVVVSTPNVVMREVVEASLAAGKHVFCEKPPGVSLEEARQFQAWAQERPGQVVKFGFNHRYLAHFQELTQLVESGELGQGMAARLTPYTYPRANAGDARVSWKDYEIFGLGSSEDTGLYEITTRRDWFEKFSGSGLEFFHAERLPYWRYLLASFQWKVVLSPPGIGEYSQRMFDHGWLAQCVMLRKTSYDYGHSWKEYLPEVDLKAADWEAQVGRVVADYRDWEERAGEYFARFMTPRALIGYLRDQLS